MSEEFHSGSNQADFSELKLHHGREDGLCVHCEKRPATLDWVGEGGVLAWTHGMYQRWCEVCADEARLDYARKIAATIPDLERKLAESIDG